MAIEGALQDVALADICQLLAMGRKTGCLSLTDRSNFGYVYFEEGRVIYASVLNRPDRLGELLVRNNVIARSELSAAMEAQAHDKGARLGELLVREGALTEEQLRRYISLQIEEAVYHLFSWGQGSFHFDTDQRPDEGVILVDISAESLLMEGARRVDEWGLIEKKIPSLDLVFEMQKNPEEADQDVEITREQNKLIPLIDGQRTVEELVHESGMVDFDVCKALYGLFQAGFVGRAGQRAQVDADGDSGAEVTQHLKLGVAFYRSGMMEDAGRKFQEVLERDPKHPGALFRLGLIAFHAGRLTEALEHFDGMPEDARQSYAVLRNRALALEKLNRFPEALEMLGWSRGGAIRRSGPCSRAGHRPPQERGCCWQHGCTQGLPHGSESQEALGPLLRLHRPGRRSGGRAGLRGPGRKGRADPLSELRTAPRQRRVRYWSGAARRKPPKDCTRARCRPSLRRPRPTRTWETRPGRGAIRRRPVSTTRRR